MGFFDAPAFTTLLSFLSSLSNLQSEENIFKASALWVFLPLFPKVGCPIFLEIRNPWGKEMERSGLTFKHFSLEVV